MRLLIALSLMVCLRVQATTFTEWYVIKGVGTNVNAGSTPDANPTFTADTGNWTNATWTFFKTALNPVTGGVTNGAWASICTNLTSTNAWLVGMVTNASDTTDTIQLSQVAFMGVNPADRIGDVVIRVGGAWAGPNTNTMAAGGGFPFAFFATTATNTPGAVACCNFKSGTTYGISNAITHSLVGPTRFQGYTTNPRDGGRAVIDGGTTLSAYTMLTLSAANVDLCDFEMKNNGGSGSASLLSVSGTECTIRGVVVNGSRGSGFSATGTSIVFDSCDAYDCTKNSNAQTGGWIIGSGNSALIRNCYSHCVNAQSSGFVVLGTATLVNCIAALNGTNGVFVTGTLSLTAINCDFYQNSGHGIEFSGTTPTSAYLVNCNFIDNTRYGITSSGSSLRNGLILNCGFGTGTQTNDSGSINLTGAINAASLLEIGSVLYPADTTPWVDPANKNFKINLSQSKSAGSSVFLDNLTSGGTAGYPDIGAAQSASTNATTRAFGFSQ